MSASLNKVTAPDDYSQAVILSCPNAARVRIQVFNQGIFWRRGFQHPGGGGVSYPEPEESLAPGLYSFAEDCDQVQVRAAVPAAQLPAGASQAVVSLSARTLEEMGG